jgi:hypothetical protein
MRDENSYYSLRLTKNKYETCHILEEINVATDSAGLLLAVMMTVR